MKKQLLLILAGVFAVILLFFFGRTTENKSKPAPASSVNAVQGYDIQQSVANAKLKLTPGQSVHISKLENGISRGDIISQQVKAYQDLAGFWKDSARNFELYAFYTAEAAKLDNSEKNLTFAAQLLLDNLRVERDQAKIDWLAAESIKLFERALTLNPESDDIKIGLGSVYIFGKGRNGDPAETMKGIQQLLSVVRKDSNNTKAQLVLGVGGFVSGQYDKAIERFHKVIALEPNNLEAVAFLADTYAAKGDRKEAIKWYTLSKRLVNNPHYNEEVDERIRQLR